MTSPALRRVVRRETHSPRTVAMFVAVILLVVALGYVAVELVLSLAGQPALLVAPDSAARWLIALPSQPAGAVVAGSVVLLLVGLIFVWLAVAPGRLSKQTLESGSRAVVVDNGVLASALAQRIADETQLPREDVSVGVGHRSVDVTVRPGLGVALDSAAVRMLAEDELARCRLSRRLRTRVRVDRPKQNDDEP